MTLEYLINYLTTGTKICIKNVDTGAIVNTNAIDLESSNVEVLEKDILSISIKNNTLYIIVTS